LVWRRFPEADVSQDELKLATLEGFDSAIGGHLLPLVGRIELFAEFFKEELDYEPADFLLGVDVQGIESEHLNIVLSHRRPFELSIATKVSAHASLAVRLSVWIEFAVHALQHVSIDIRLRIIFGVVFGSRVPPGLGTWLRNYFACPFYVSMCLARDG
jgi:hypothetical protein